MIIDFERSTLNIIREFQKNMKSLIATYPNFDFESAINYLKTGEKSENIPNDAYDKIEKLNELRKKAIQNEMRRAAAQAKLKGEELDPKFLDGSDYTYCFSEETYNEYPKFAVYNFVQFGPPLPVKNADKEYKKTTSDGR